jgi:branched-chain amino acid aminotransferase
MKSPVCYIRGKFKLMDEASFSVNDLGVQRGYGIFDFLRVSNNIPLFIEDHLDRFFNSAQEMRLSFNESRHELKDIVFQLIRENNLSSSGIRIILTGGVSPDGYKIISPELAIVQQAITPPPDEMALPGIHLLSYPFQRQIAHVKTTDYLMAIWLQPWLRKNGGDDMLYHHEGIFSECPRSNIFLVTNDGRLVTPGRNILKGITRKQVIRLALEIGITVEERDITFHEIRAAREAFITSSTKRLVPVRQLDHIKFEQKKADSVTGLLWDRFFALEMSFRH